MAPEQAVGGTVDRRADIWAFGVVLYEMLTGRRLYAGDSSAEILASVIKDEPKLDQLQPRARYIIERCLRKDPRRRWQGIGDVRTAIDEPQIPDSSFAVPRWRLWAWMTLSALLLIGLAALATVHFREPHQEAGMLRFTVPPPPGTAFTPLSRPAVSPDGHRLAFVATLDNKDSIWVRDLESLAARQLSGTEGASNPFWSPDSRFLAFFAEGKLKKIDVAGGGAVALCEAPSALGGSWGTKGVIVFSVATNLSRVSEAGGVATRLPAFNLAIEYISGPPSFLPDGRHVLYGIVNLDPAKSAYVIDVDAKDGLNNRRGTLAGTINPVYAQPGYLLSLRQRTLMAQPFDASKVQSTGDPVPIAEQVDYYNDFWSGALGHFSASNNGVLAYRAGGSGGDVQLTWCDRSGKVTGAVGPPGIMSWPEVSPDGNSVAVGRQDPRTGLSDLWLYDLLGGTAYRITFNSKSNDSPEWSPDGSHVAYASRTGNGFWTVYQKATTGTSREEVLDNPQRATFPMDWSRDGRYIVESVTDPKTNGDIWVLPLFGDRKPFPYVQTPATETYPKLSANNRWLAYTSDETGRYEIYVQSFPTPGAKYQVSTDGGTVPVWSRDGKELFFLGLNQQMMSAEVKAGDKFEFTPAKALFRLPPGSAAGPWFTVGKDNRFLIAVPSEQAGHTPMTVVVNWTAGLKK